MTLAAKSRDHPLHSLRLSYAADSLDGEGDGEQPQQGPLPASPSVPPDQNPDDTRLSGLSKAQRGLQGHGDGCVCAGGAVARRRETRDKEQVVHQYPEGNRG